MSAKKGHKMVHSPFTFLSMPGKKVCSSRAVMSTKAINGQWPVWADDPLHCIWPCVGSQRRACYYWFSLVLWVTSSCPQGRLFRLVLGLPSSSHMEHCRGCLCLLPSRRCLSVISFSPFLVKVSSRGVRKVQDGWHWVGRRGSQSSSSSGNDGFTPPVLSQDSHKGKCLS